MTRLSVLSLMALAACGGGGGDAPDAAAPDAPPSRVYGGDRPVELQVPPGLDPAERYPLVVMLHGYGVTGLLETAYLQLGDVPSYPAFYLAPDGTVDSSGHQHWNAGDACCGGGNDADDVAYIGGLIDDVVADWPVDPTRVFVLGHSNGAFMAYRMACERADVITAIAGLAGGATSLDGSGCTPVQPVSVLHIHGTADTTVPYDGGVLNAPYPGAVASVTQWADKDGCDPTLTPGTPFDLVRDLAGDETTPSTAGCTGGVGVELWTIEGGVHIPNFVTGGSTRMIDWLVAHPR